MSPRRLAALAAAALLIASGSHPGEPAGLRPGEFVWHPERAPHGPVVVVVSIPEQQARVFRNGVEIGRSTVSTGRSGYPTPTGVFSILEKQREHYSNLYDDAPMPNMERLTWGGVALHAGTVPGRPASHGCIRLPLAFSERLYEVTSTSSTLVVVADERTDPGLHHAGLLLPPVRSAGPAPAAEADREDLPWSFHPERAPSGPVSLLLSTADRRLYVMRSGREIGRAGYELRDAAAALPVGVYTLLEGPAPGEPVLARGRPARRWLGVGVAHPTPDADPAAPDRLRLPPAFRWALEEVLAPGTTLVVTDLPALEETPDARTFTVLTSREVCAE
jgi:L,D-transpeptidase catalytic domain